MIGFSVNSARGLFFDRPAVMAAVSAARLRVLRHAGGLLRKLARNSIRKRKKASAPGSPPSSHSGILKRFIYFAWDSSSRSLIVGPARTNQVFFDGDGRPVTGTVPEVLEFGGQIGVLEARNPFSGKWGRADLRYRRTNNGGQATWERRRRTITIPARPYMGPALLKVTPQFPALWQNAVRRAA
jgi:hypothetical protein